MRNFFNFFPVGQGLFYCGLLCNGNFCFVYDCGAEPKNSDLSPFIKELSLWNKNKEIDFLVISHFHEDHINNIKNLRKSFKIKRYILPYISYNSDVSVFVLAMYYFMDKDNIDKEQNFDLFKFLANLYRQEHITLSSESDFQFEESDHNNILTGESTYTCFYYKWVFKFFNKNDSKISDKTKDLLDEINNLRINEENKTIEEILEEDDGLSKLKSIYKKIFGDKKLNETSLVLLHYPNLSPSYFKCYTNEIALGKKYIHSPYTLLTGDIPFDEKLAENVIKGFPTGTSGIVQVPHHGAKNEWLKFCEFFYKFDVYVVPFGIENHYGHPSPFVRTRVSEDSYYEVTEFCGFNYCIDVW